jgi:hypothetical protein
MIYATVPLLPSAFFSPDHTTVLKAHLQQEWVQILYNIRMLPNVTSFTICENFYLAIGYA